MGWTGGATRGLGKEWSSLDTGDEGMGEVRYGEAGNEHEGLGRVRWYGGRGER